MGHHRPSLTFWPIYDGLDVNVTATIAWFHPNHDMVARRIYRLSIYGEHCITFCDHRACLSRMRHRHGHWVCWVCRWVEITVFFQREGRTLLLEVSLTCYFVP